MSLASTASLLGIILLISVGACYALFGETLTDIVHLAWSDATFTGRTYLWTFMLGAISKNWITGIGFGSFWGAGDHSPNLYAPLDYIRLTNQAHNGYLDLLAALGVIGTLLVIVMLVHALGKAERLRFTQPWLFRLICFVIIFSVIHNGMESSLLVPFSFVWHFTLFACVLAIWKPEQVPP
jgi:O-antigen ligase